MEIKKVFTIIPILTLFLHINLTGGHEVGAIDYCMGVRITKIN